MHREYHSWYSSRVGKEMGMLVFGHGGARVLVFPTSHGSFFEWEDRGMTAALGEHLERGWIQMYCVDGYNMESWYAEGLHPADRARRHILYEDYILSEVLPLSTFKNPNPYLIVTGASLGAYHAANLAFRHPHLVGRIIGLSGRYDIRFQTEGYSDDNVYFNNPSDYLAHEHDHERLEAMRRMDIILAVGRGDPAYPNNEHISRLLWQKGVGNALRVWDGWAHDWPWWRQMIRLYIGGHD